MNDVLTSDPAEVIGRRIGAALLDIVLMAILMVVVGLAFGEGESSGGSASVTLEGVSALVYFALVLVYYSATEAVWGATVGKRALGLSVVDAETGGRAGGGKVVARNLLRIVDILPILYLLGLIVMLATPNKQRIGDLAAGTVVVPRQAAPPGAP